MKADPSKVKCPICKGNTYLKLDCRGHIPFGSSREKPALTCEGCDLKVEYCSCTGFASPECIVN